MAKTVGTAGESIKIYAKNSVQSSNIFSFSTPIWTISTPEPALPNTPGHFVIQQAGRTQAAVFFDDSRAVDGNPTGSADFQEQVKPSEWKYLSMGALDGSRNIRICQKGTRPAHPLKNNLDQPRIGKPKHLAGQGFRLLRLKWGYCPLSRKGTRHTDRAGMDLPAEILPGTEVLDAEPAPLLNPRGDL